VAVADVVAAAADAAAVAGVEEHRMKRTQHFRQQEASVTRDPIPTGLRRVVAALALALPLAVGAQQQQSFATPEAAADALVAALKANDEAALVALVGANYRHLVGTGDAVHDANTRAQAAAALAAWRSFEERGANRRVLVMGTQAWRFPIPIVRDGNSWRFASAEGAEELLNRRIGGNERNAIQVLRAYVDAQRQYAAADRDGDGVLQYARRLGSSAGKRDGLYWQSGPEEELSPFGPLVAGSSGELAARKRDDAYRGYHFRILERQGSHAAGGAYSYIVNGRMLGGFAMVAYPAEYGASGVMTFIVNQNGKVFQKSLGQSTAEVASKMTSFDPGPGWTPVEP
jgi:hypothetical protein